MWSLKKRALKTEGIGTSIRIIGLGQNNITVARSLASHEINLDLKPSRLKAPEVKSKVAP